MKLKIPGLHLHPEHLPFFPGGHITEAPPLETASQQHLSFEDDLLLGTDIPDDPRFLLADDLEKISHPHITPEQKKIILEMIASDAKGLAATILPDITSVKLGITSSLPPRDTYHPPSMPEVLLLAEARDITGNQELDKAVTHILETTPPAFSEPLIVAHNKAIAENRPITDVYLEVLAEIDAKIEKPKSAEDLDFVLNMRNATPADKRNIEWDKKVEENERD